MKTLAVIPARYSSTRLPSKPLVEIAGVPLVLRVLNNVRSCPSVDRVIVATDDERIAEVVARGGGEALMTPSELPSGGDRVAYAAKRIENSEEVAAPNVVKAVFDGGGRAMYFSRSPIPYPRNEGGVWYKHIGPYGWRRDFLLEFAAMEQTPLEKAESLEMLRVIERGRSIKCVEAARDTIEIDTPEDLTRIEKYFRRGF